MKTLEEKAKEKIEAGRKFVYEWEPDEKDFGDYLSD